MHGSGRRSAIGRRVLVAVLALALIAAACDSDASDDSGGDGNGAGDGTDNTEVFGAPDPATGEPFRVGSITTSGAEAVDTSEYTTAAVATADYVNEYLGGIEGRPLEVLPCGNQNTAAGATECINQFVQDGVSAILVGSSGLGEVQATEAAEAGLPYVAFLGAALAELTNPNSTSMSGAALAIIGSPGVVMEREGQTKLGILTIDVPTATQAIEALAIPQYEAAGIDVELVPVAPGTPDASAQVSAVPDAELWLVIGDAAFCATALSSVQTQAPGVPVIAPDQCLDADGASALPNGYEGVTSVAANRLDPEDEETDLFFAVLDEYADPDEVEAGTQGFLVEGFSTVLGFDRLMEGYTGDGDPESVGAHVSAASGLLPLGGGIEMTCGSPPVDFLGSLCSVSGYLVELDADGDPVEFELIDVAPFFTG